MSNTSFPPLPKGAISEPINKDSGLPPLPKGATSTSKPSEEIDFSEPTFKEKVGAVAYGFGTSIPGMFGDIEAILPGGPEVGHKIKEGPLKGYETVFPTTENIQTGLTKLGFPQPREEVSGYKKGGEIFGGLAASIPSLLKTGTRALLGTASKTGEASARQAERLGFKLSPAQVRQDVPISAQGATSLIKNYSPENQTLANRLASRGTGKEVSEITEKTIRDQFDTLGAEFNALYKGKVFQIDPSMKYVLDNILQKESDLGFAGSTTVRQATQAIANNIQNRVILGDDLQRLRNALTQRARSTENKGNAHEIYNLVDQLDGAVGMFNKNLTQQLSVLRPQYRNTIILEDLFKAGGIKQGNISLERLGTVLREDASRIKSPRDIDELGKLGRDLGIVARWEASGKKGTDTADILGQALSTKLSIIPKSLGLRSSLARTAQRKLADSPVSPIEKVGAVAPVAQTVQQFKDKEEQ